jgi:hypothetical protein
VPVQKRCTHQDYGTYYNQLLFLCDQKAPHSSASIMQEQEEATATAAQHNSSLTADIMEMICTHLNYTLN